MGTCSCINSNSPKDELNLDLQRVKEISKFNIKTSQIYNI